MLKTWFLAGRPWSLTATFVPVTLGAVLAWSQGYFHPFLFLLSLVGGAFIQLGTNYTNTYGDYLSGVDTVESTRTCPQLVLGLLKPSHMLWVGIGCFAVAALIGVYLVYLRGWPLLVVGVLGILGGYGYTLGVAYKYKGLGTILVFFLMGPMMAWGAYYVQTGVSSWLPVLASLPVGFLISNLLHANDFRDIPHDTAAGIVTLGTILGFDRSLVFYYLLNIAAYVCLVLLVIFHVLPVASLLALLALPKAWRQLRDAREGWAGDREKLTWLEPNHAQLHFQFGLLLLGGLLLDLVL
ncbi:MAG TPA: 1,4-dihydroxy-2-naphthoate octaprenyltransferase [Clostridia bacterium]|nr:1,4-dihydroxy-2-naphthoate octaprenyltransferase [Clostridia bacterium]